MHRKLYDEFGEKFKRQIKKCITLSHGKHELEDKIKNFKLELTDRKLKCTLKNFKMWSENSILNNDIIFDDIFKIENSPTPPLHFTSLLVDKSPISFVSKIKSYKADNSLKQVVELIKIEDYTGATQILNSILSYNPTHVDSVVCLGVIYANINSLECAIEKFEQAYQLDENHPNCKNYLVASLENFIQQCLELDEREQVLLYSEKLLKYDEKSYYLVSIKSKLLQISSINVQNGEISDAQRISSKLKKIMENDYNISTLMLIVNYCFNPMAAS
ncbi:hypothetical protein A3Q56_00672 [Intoshia linei]|uniref:Uncharacterized protein n=1 Tax=Intoshia linei TaxID=1819745 RepID=A0A177BD10_9BILA|nr:hypothetical protein A3Q56_00672 [Intoshia linei]